MPIRTIVNLLFPLVVGLSSCTQDVNSQLIEAARNDQTESIQALLEAGAEVDAKDE